MLHSAVSGTAKITMLLPKTSYRALSTGFATRSLLRSKVCRVPVCRRFIVTSLRAMTNSSIIASRHDNITKGATDKREYRGLVLTNGLKVLLISDPNADKSAAAMDVAVGHLMDPWELPGTAHFCEHMLFLGTEKYPQENEYGKFITSNGGESNAFTSSDHTNYHFDVKPTELYGGLDRFVQFFLGPQFTESATEREVCAVDSEHSNYLNSDSWRILQIDRSLCRPGHDYGKFGTGNKKTLMEDARKQNIEPREALLKFHKTWYSSNIMSCVIAGKESLDELESYLGSLNFHEIKNKNVDMKQWDEHPYGADQLKKRINIVPIQDSRMFRMVFPIPDTTPEYKSKPANYISHLIGHEGKGSLLSELKRRGWASSLSAGKATLGRGMAVFDITGDLSPEGLSHVDEIIKLLFNYIATIKATGPQKFVQDELRQLSETRFQYLDKQNPLPYVTHLASHLQRKPFEDVLSFQYLIPEFKPDSISEILDLLNPDNMFCEVVSKTFEGQEGNTNEPIYGTEMRIESIPENTLESYREALATINPVFLLPEPNIYIASKFDLKVDKELSKHPRIVYQDDYTRVWYKEDMQFNVPKLLTRIVVHSSIYATSTRLHILQALHSSCLYDSINGETYDALLAGMKGEIKMFDGKVQFSIFGYDEKQAVFAQDLVKYFLNFKSDPLRYDVIREAFIRTIENAVHSQPYQHAEYCNKMLMADKFWTNEQILSVLNEISIKDVNNFVKEHFGAFHVTVYGHGNAKEEEIIDLSKNVTNLFKDAMTTHRPLYKNEFFRNHEIALEKQTEHVYHHYQTTHDCSCVSVLFQVGLEINQNWAAAELLVQLLREAAFVQLRTTEQLGYIVWTGNRFSNRTVGLELIVQGPKDPAHVLERIDSFLEVSRKTIADMSDEEYAQHVDGLCANILIKPKTLNKQALRFWGEISKELYDFDRLDNLAEEVRSLSKADILKFFDERIAADAPKRRKLSVFVHSNADEPGSGKIVREEGSDKKYPVEIESPEEFKTFLSRYGMTKPKLDISSIGIDPKNTFKSK